MTYIHLDAQYVAQQIERLMETYADVLEDDDALRHDMISGSTEIDQVVSRALDHMAEAEMVIAGIKDRASHLKAREARFQRRSDAMRSLILQLMTKANIRSLPLPEATITRSEGKFFVVINDESSLPRQLGTSTWAPDKRAISRQISAGETVPGASLEKGDDTLRISKK